jgi:hypothetical protein
MNKIIAVAFSNETRAYEGLKALKELHAEGSLTIYSAAVITRDADANITVKEWADPGAIRTGLGRVIGGLIVLLRTPDWNVYRCTGRHNCEFSCVIADIDEELVNPLDARIEPLGGGITRRPRWDFVDEIELRSDNRNIASGDSADGACQFQPLEATPQIVRCRRNSRNCDFSIRGGLTQTFQIAARTVHHVWNEGCIRPSSVPQC